MLQNKRVCLQTVVITSSIQERKKGNRDLKIKKKKFRVNLIQFERWKTYTQQQQPDPVAVADVFLSI